MAKFSKSISFKNATVNKEKDLITEVFKDETKFYSISKLIADWDGVDGISVTIKKDDELESEDCIDGEED